MAWGRREALDGRVVDMCSLPVRPLHLRSSPTPPSSCARATAPLTAQHRASSTAPIGWLNSPPADQPAAHGNHRAGGCAAAAASRVPRAAPRRGTPGVRVPQRQSRSRSKEGREGEGKGEPRVPPLATQQQTESAAAPRSGPQGSRRRRRERPGGRQCQREER